MISRHIDVIGIGRLRFTASIRNNYKNLEKTVIDVSGDIDSLIARRKLAAWGIEIDTLTEEQEKYLHSWEV